MRFPRFRSLRTTILWLFVPTISAFILLSGLISYQLAAAQLKENAYSSISDTLSQTSHFVNERLTALFTELNILSKDYDLNMLIKKLQNADYTLTPEDYLTINTKLNKIYSDYYSIVDTIYVSLNYGQTIFQKKYDYYSTYDYDYIPYSDYDSNSVIVQWKGFQQPDTSREDTDPEQVTFISMYKFLENRELTPDGFILFELREQFFNDYLASPQISESGYLMLISPDSDIYFKPVDSRYSLQPDMISKIQLSSEPAGVEEMLSADGVKLIVLYDTIEINKWRIAAVFPKNELLLKIESIKYVTLISMGIMMICAMIFSIILARLLTQPLIKLTRIVNKIGNGNLKLQFDKELPNEIGVLSRGVQNLILRIEDLLVEVENKQIQVKNAEFKVLQAQIQPHFLYNTLYSIRQLCDMGLARDASKMVQAMSNYYRTSISRGIEIITIKEELEHIENYLFIQHMRYGDDFDYRIAVDPALYPYKILKLTLQPLLENALYHGVKQQRSKGEIRVTGAFHCGQIRFQVIDNGAGMSAERLAEITASLEDPESEHSQVGYGVRNVQMRLRMQYGPSCGLTYESEPGKGTCVTVIICQQE
ncbi:sensor histidine kinase [Paenibacillus fonticola]|uniref:sensor histidine kinase n=1 Tax=Paenibacillus fonticola TaxID=379896 RepID=UPI00036B53D7|nr:sensor histidine kinase [Paenibacillus fonticola]